MARYALSGSDGERGDRTFGKSVYLPARRIALGHTHEEIAAFSLGEFREIWREPNQSLATRSPGHPNLAGATVRPTPSGDRAFYYPGRLNTEDGKFIAVFDPEARAFGPRYAGPVDAHAVATLPPGPVSPNGVILALGSREGDPDEEPVWLYLIDPETLTFNDSIPEAELPPISGPFGLFTEHDGRHVLWMGETTPYEPTLQLYDLLSRQVVDRAPVSGWFPGVAFDPHSRRFAVFYRADWFYPAPGVVHVFDEHLRRTDIGLRDHFHDEFRDYTEEAEVGPSVVAATWGDDGLLYLHTGDGGSGHPPRVVVVDPDAGSVLAVFPIGESGDQPLALWFVPG